MCQMYAIFEEVVGPQPSVTFTKDLQGSEGDDQGVVADCGDAQSSAEPDDTASQYDSSKSKTKKSPCKHPRIYRYRNSSTLPRHGSRRRLPSNSDLDDTSSTTSSSNPLLDTISVLTYDPPDDSDDYYDLTNVVYDQSSHAKEEGEKQVKAPVSGTTPVTTEGDRDSIGYAGSSSIDSGYKSFCPTPELPDPSFYETDRTQQYSGFYPDSSSSLQGRGCSKPRIMMGTKVISSRQGQVSPTTLRESPVSRRSDSSLYDVNLDHLMYLRQSLLSAIQKCESSKADSTSPNNKQRKEPPCTDKSLNLVEDQRYTDYSPVKNPSYQKTVRFNTDVKVSTVNSSQPPSENADPNHCSSRTGDSSGDPPSNKVHQSKSILKDPLCANLRSHLEAGSSDCTLEEEIDSLLYGRAEFYDLESVDEFPCSYVTMIEEKYRSGKPSLAKVRKLKGGKISDQASKPPPATENDESSQAVPTTEEDSKQQKNPKDSPSSTVSISKTAKCRFTEVARCMLEIIEDLQMKKLQPEAAKETTSPASAAAETAKTPAEASSEEKKEDSSSSATDSKSQLYSSAAEYHVYEEIAYDFVGEKPPVFKVPDLPPPLPARPTTMFSKVPDQMRPRAPSPPPRKSRCPQKKNNNPQVQVPLEGSTSVAVRNRPKQRGNLYCLFADQAERRSISRSLEREFRVSGPDNQDDDYGFRKEFLSI